MPSWKNYNYARKNTSTERAKGNQFLIVGPSTHCGYGTETDTIIARNNIHHSKKYASRIRLPVKNMSPVSSKYREAGYNDVHP